MRKPRNFCGQGDVFSRQWCSSLNVCNTGAKQFGLSFAVAGTINEFRPHCFDIEIVAIGTLVASEQYFDLGAAESIDCRPLPRRRAHT